MTLKGLRKGAYDFKGFGETRDFGKEVCTQETSLNPLRPKLGTYYIFKFILFK